MIASSSEDVSEFFVPAISRATPWSTEVLMIGTPSVIFIELPKLRALRTGKTWSWYIPKNASVPFKFFFENAVSAIMA